MKSNFHTLVRQNIYNFLVLIASYWYLFIQFLHSFIHSFIRLFIHSFLHSFINQFFHLFIHLFIYLSIHLFIHLFIYNLFINMTTTLESGIKPGFINFNQICSPLFIPSPVYPPSLIFRKITKKFREPVTLTNDILFI